MKIYTKTGDKGQTSLAVGGRVSKCDKRLEAYGTADELNSFVGLLRAGVAQSPSFADTEVDVQLEWIQNRLFDIGGVLAGADIPLPEQIVCQLETWIDAMQCELPELRAFILPGGSELIARCHVCRTVARRLERAIIACYEGGEKPCPTNVLCFVNRLSDYCFVLSRWVAKVEKIMPFVWKKS